MKKEIYQGIPVGDDMQAFEFVSIGRKGPIVKRIEFILTGAPKVYSLVFGDVDKEGKIDYYAISDNGDRDKILATVVRVVEVYCCKYPERWIKFSGSTRARTRLYRMAIGLNLDKLSKKFDIYADVNDEWFRFNKNIEANGFLIKRKNL